MFEFSRKDIVSLYCLKQQREALGMPISELSRRTGFAPNTIRNIEAGNSNPTWPTVLSIAAELGMVVRMEWVGMPAMKGHINE